jgi:hypothetical protein
MLLCLQIQGPCECDVSFGSFQVCNQLNRIVNAKEDQDSIFDQWLMPEDPIVFSSASKCYEIPALNCSCHDINLVIFHVLDFFTLLLQKMNQ